MVSILLSKWFPVKKLSWCLFCHSLLLHLNDDTRRKNIFFCRVPAIKANCRTKGKIQTQLEIRRGPGHPNLEIRGRPGLQKIFSAFRTSVWCKNKGSRAPRAPPLDPPTACLQKLLLTSKHFCKEYFVERNQTKSTAAAYFKLQMSIEEWHTLMRLE